MKVTTSGFTSFSKEARALESFRPDMQGASSEVTTYLEDLNRRLRLEGRDRYGDTLPPIKESTRKWREMRGKGQGPALVPDSESSRAITNFRVTTTQTEAGMHLTAAWEGQPHLLYHANSTGVHFPVRDILGFPDQDWERIDDIVTAHVDRQFASLSSSREAGGPVSGLGREGL